MRHVNYELEEWRKMYLELRDAALTASLLMIAGATSRMSPSSQGASSITDLMDLVSAREIGLERSRSCAICRWNERNQRRALQRGQMPARAGCVQSARFSGV